LCKAVRSRSSSRSYSSSMYIISRRSRESFSLGVVGLTTLFCVSTSHVTLSKPQVSTLSGENFQTNSEGWFLYHHSNSGIRRYNTMPVGRFTSHSSSQTRVRFWFQLYHVLKGPRAPGSMAVSLFSRVRFRGPCTTVGTLDCWWLVVSC
jgi:hypothetical protein